MLLLEKYAVSDPVNIGSGDEVKIKEIVKIILQNSERKNVKLIFDNKKPTTIPVRKVDVSKANKVIGFKKMISLQDGLSQTINWYKSNL